jgi:hypothetical protein
VPGLCEFDTRPVSHAADDDESVALLGTDGAETLGAVEPLLVRLQRRLPVPGSNHPAISSALRRSSYRLAFVHTAAL